MTGKVDLTTVHGITGADHMMPRINEGIRPVPPLIDAYYDAVRKEYLVKNGGGRWLPHDTTNFKRILRRDGISTSRADGAPLSPAEAVMLDIQDTRDVTYAGRLAGRDAGFYDEGGIRFLVTESPQIIEPMEGEWGTIAALLDGLIGADPEHGATQIQSVKGWLQVGYQALRARRLQPGQALAFAGPPQSGKSLLQGLFTEILGGRGAKAYRYLSGTTDFNSELFGAEHLLLEDEQSTTDIRSRLNLGASLKGIAVNEVHSCHAKGREAVNLRPFWRLSISLNDDPEHLMVLPPVDDHIADKLILLKCSRPETPFPTGSHEMRRKYREQLVSELPAFLHSICAWQIPEDRKDERFGIRYFHHPELLEALQMLAPEARLLDLIDAELWQGNPEITWEGTSTELEQRLTRDSSEIRYEARKLLSSWSQACGAYLGRLADSHPHRVERSRTKNARLWTVKAPLMTL